MRHLAILLLPAAATAAQLEVLTLPNWQRVPVGEGALLEGGAMVARASGPAACFNNPAGLAGLERPTISGTLSLVEYTRTASRTAGGNASADQAQMRPNLVGFAEAVDESEPAGAGWSLTLATPIDWGSTLEVRASTGGGTRRDTGRSSLTVLAPAVGLGWEAAPGLRLGTALEGWIAEYRFDSGTTVADPTTSLTSTYSESGRQLALRLALGAQWNHGTVSLGASLRSPGWRLADNGQVSAATTSGDAAAVTTTTVDDTDAGFVLPLPFAATVGLAWRPDFADGLLTGEVDVAFVAGGPSRTVLGSATGTTTTINGGTTTTPFVLPDRVHDPHWVLNPRAGLQWRLPWIILGRTVRLHAGGYMDRSPVTDSDVFTRINLLGATAGISAERGPLRASLGGVYVTNASLSEAFGYVTAPQAGFQPALERTDASFAVRSFILAIGTSYRFNP